MTAADYNDCGSPWSPRAGRRASGATPTTTRGNRTSSTDPRGPTTRYAYDDAGHLTAVTDALGHTTHRHHRRGGPPAAVTDPLGHTTRVERDAFGRVTGSPMPSAAPPGRLDRRRQAARRETPDGARESWTWDAEGNLVDTDAPATHAYTTPTST